MEDAMCIGRCKVKVVKVQDVSMKDTVCSMKDNVCSMKDAS